MSKVLIPTLHEAGVWSSSHTYTDETGVQQSGYAKEALVYGEEEKITRYVSLVKQNTAELSDTDAWAQLDTYGALCKYVDSVAAEIETQPLTKEHVTINIIYSGGTPSSNPTLTVWNISTKEYIYNAEITDQTVELYIAPGVQYYVEVTDLVDFTPPSRVTYTAESGNSRVVNMTYKYMKEGVMIQLKDGSIVETADYDATTMEYNGVYVSDGEHAVIVGTEDMCYLWNEEGSSFTYTMGWCMVNGSWSYSDVVVPNCYCNSNSTQAVTDFAGEANTDAIIAYDATDEAAEAVRSHPAAALCRAFQFPDGDYGYWPAAGEMNMIMQNLDAVNEAMTAIGGSSVQSANYWSSSQSSSNNSWRVYTSGVGGIGTGLAYRVRAVSAF